MFSQIIFLFNPSTRRSNEEGNHLYAYRGDPAVDCGKHLRLPEEEGGDLISQKELRHIVTGFYDTFADSDPKVRVKAIATGKELKNVEVTIVAKKEAIQKFLEKDTNA